MYLDVCGGGGGLFPVGPSIHRVKKLAEVIGMQSTMYGRKSSEYRALQAMHATGKQSLTRQQVH